MKSTSKHNRSQELEELAGGSMAATGCPTECKLTMSLRWLPLATNESGPRPDRVGESRTASPALDDTEPASLARTQAHTWGWPNSGGLDGWPNTNNLSIFGASERLGRPDLN